MGQRFDDRQAQKEGPLTSIWSSDSTVRSASPNTKHQSHFPAVTSGHIRHNAYSLFKASATPSCQLSTDLSPGSSLSLLSSALSMSFSLSLPHFSGMSTLWLSSELLQERCFPSGAHSSGKSDFCRKFSAPQVLSWIAFPEWTLTNSKWGVPTHLFFMTQEAAFPLWTYFICKRWHIQMHLGFFLIGCGKTADRKQWSWRKNFIFLDTYKKIVMLCRDT